MNKENKKEVVVMEEEKSDWGKVFDGFLALCNLTMLFMIWLSKKVWDFIIWLSNFVEKKFKESSRKKR